MKLSEQMRNRITFDLPVDDDTIEDWAEEVAKLEAKNEALREELNLITDGRWTQLEIDAGKWRAHELHALLTGESDEQS